MSLSGGLPYHLKALRFKKDLWDSHEAGVASFLDAWNPRAKNLILVGPSGGYSLPTEWLKRFQVIKAVEPDFLARIICETRHQIKPEWYRRKYPFHDPDALVLLKDSDAAILFCNLLGQIEIKSTTRLRKTLEHSLQGREWASYHDALSGDAVEFDLEDAPRKRASLAQMKSWIYVKGPRSGPIKVNAHYAPELFQFRDDLNFRYWQWRITPHYTHLIEGVFSERQKTDADQ
jgi:hypothetical protein